MTTEEFEAFIARRLAAKHLAELSWSELVSIIGGANTAQRNTLITMFKDGNGNTAGEVMQSAIVKQMESDALAVAKSMLSNGSLSQAELLRIFG